MTPEGQDPTYATLLAATLGHLMLAVAKELFPHRTYFDLAPTEKETVADGIRTLLHETQAAFGGPELILSRKSPPFPPQREEDYL